MQEFASAPAAGTKYGTYLDAIGLEGGAAWVAGSASDTVALKFFTADATLLVTGGSNSADAGKANLTVVPEPGIVVLSVAALLAVMGKARRRQRITAD